MKSGNLNFVEPSGPLQACNGTALPFSCKVPVILDRFQRNFNFDDRVSKYTQISNFIKIRSVAAELFRTDGRTDTTKLIFAFRNSANAPSKLSRYSTFIRKFEPPNPHNVQKEFTKTALRIFGLMQYFVTLVNASMRQHFSIIRLRISYFQTFSSSFPSI